MRIIFTCATGIIVAAVAIALTTTGGGGSVPKRPKTVAAGFYPLAFAAEEIGGPGVKVENLTPPGVEPHDLEPTPREVEELQSADLDLLMGGGFQPQLERASSDSRGKVADLLDTAGLKVWPRDPHVWLDPHRFALIARRIGAAMGEEGAAAAFVRRLDALDRQYRTGLAHCARRDIVTSHEAFAYVAQRYGLRQIAVTGISPEAEPTPGEVQHAVDAIRRSRATTVFHETLVSPRLAETVARESGASNAVLNPIEGLTSDEKRAGKDYFALMRENLAALRKGLGCR
jgi:zinc transport system substrate-binding protein